MSAPSALYQAQMQTLAGYLDELFNGDAKGADRQVGFALFVFEANVAGGAQVNFVSNVARESMVAAVKEWLGRQDGGAPPTVQ